MRVLAREGSPKGVQSTTVPDCKLPGAGMRQGSFAFCKLLRSPISFRRWQLLGCSSNRKIPRGGARNPHISVPGTCTLHGTHGPGTHGCGPSWHSCQSLYSVRKRRKGTRSVRGQLRLLTTRRHPLRGCFLFGGVGKQGILGVVVSMGRERERKRLIVATWRGWKVELGSCSLDGGALKMTRTEAEVL